MKFAHQDFWRTWYVHKSYEILSLNRFQKFSAFCNHLPTSFNSKHFVPLLPKAQNCLLRANFDQPKPLRTNNAHSEPDAPIPNHRSMAPYQKNSTFRKPALETHWYMRQLQKGRTWCPSRTIRKIAFSRWVLMTSNTDLHDMSCAFLRIIVWPRIFHRCW